MSDESGEFGGKATLGVDLKIEEGGGDRGTRAEGQQHDEKPAGVGTKQAADDAPEHRSICCARVWHHSPRRMGAGSMRDARCSGRALPRIVTIAASAIITKKTMSEGSGAAPKILSPRRRARIIPSA